MTKGATSPQLRELARRIRANDAGAFDAFLADQWTPLIRYVASLTGSVDDAQDLAQEAFLRVWEQRSGLRPSASLRAYLYQIARNLTINELKSRDLHRVLGARHARELPAVRTPGREYEISQVGERVRAAIAALPERRREAFVLAHLQDLPHREIAEIMGISPQTVANQISAALGELRETLRPLLAEDPVAAAR